MVSNVLFILAHYINIRSPLGVDEVISAMTCVTKGPKRNF